MSGDGQRMGNPQAGARFECDECALGRDCERHDPPFEPTMGNPQAGQPGKAPFPPALSGAGEKLTTTDEWLAECDRVERARSSAALPIDGAMLCLHMRTSRRLRRREWDRVVLVPGLLCGRVVGEVEPRYYLVEVRAADVRRTVAAS